MGRIQCNEESSLIMPSEFDYLGNPAVSKLFDMVLQLSVDLHVVAHRQSMLEIALERNGVLAKNALDSLVPSEEETKELGAAREARLGRILRIITEDGPAAHPLRQQWEDRLINEKSKS